MVKVIFALAILVAVVIAVAIVVGILVWIKNRLVGAVNRSRADRGV